jgi:transposase
MIQITPQMRIVAAVEPVDFRKGIDGLSRLCQDTLRHDPFSGWVFVFRNRPATALKILIYDGQGFWLCHKKQMARPKSEDPRPTFPEHEPYQITPFCQTFSVLLEWQCYGFAARARG